MGKIITVDFHGDTLFAVQRENGVFVAISPICQALGLAPQRQRERIQRDPILSEGGTMVVLPSPGGPQETFCLRLDLVNGWLFTIDESRVKDEPTREKVLAYKRECYAVLFRHFYPAPGSPVSVVPAPDEDLSTAEGVRVSMVREARQVFGPKSAGQLWFVLRLPVVPAMREALAQQPDLFQSDDSGAVVVTVRAPRPSPETH